MKPEDAPEQGDDPVPSPSKRPVWMVTRVNPGGDDVSLDSDATASSRLGQLLGRLFARFRTGGLFGQGGGEK